MFTSPGITVRVVFGFLLPATVLLTGACDRKTADELPLIPLAVEQPCDIQQGCRAGDTDLSLVLMFGQELQPLKPFPVKVHVQSEIPVTSVTVAFSMANMDMGQNRYRLISDGASAWFANVTLPVCSAGRSDWIADIELLAKGRRYKVQLPFAVGK